VKDGLLVTTDLTPFSILLTFLAQAALFASVASQQTYFCNVGLFAAGHRNDNLVVWCFPASEDISCLVREPIV
jgi:hypothetical protein